MYTASEIVLGAGAGTVASEIVAILKLVIAEAKIVYDFPYLSEEFATTMEALLPIILKIDSMQKLDDIKPLKVTIKKAQVLVTKCSEVKGWELHKKSYYSRKVWKIQKEMVNFCEVQLPLQSHVNQLETMKDIKKLNDLTVNIDSNHQIFEDKLDGWMQEMSKSHQIIDGKLDQLIPLPECRHLCSVPELVKAPVGFDVPFMELKKELLDDSVESLLVSGPPGCGKTMLVIQLCHDEDIKRNFKHIFYNVVSSTPNSRALAQNIFEHNGFQGVTIENDSQIVVALGKLWEKLKGNGILLVLDDVWFGADSLLENFSIDIPDLKILMTSRFHFSGLDSPYHLKPLEDKDAIRLLSQLASKPYHTSQTEYEDLLQKILGRCNGLPLIIQELGSSLEGQSLNFWKDKVDIWSKGETILDNTSLLYSLQPSFRDLNPNLQRYFLDMGLFLEDQPIRVSSIIDIWAELYGKDSIDCMKYLEELASQNLLQLDSRGKTHEDGFYNEFLVTQYIILRELAIHQSEKETILEKERLNLRIQDDKFPDWCSNLRKPINARLLSISTDKSFSSNWINMDFPNVEALILHVSSSNYALPSFIAGMENLNVLTVTNHEFNLAMLINFSCLSSLPNLKRIRLENALLTSFNILQLRLTSLKKLSLVKCSFGEVFYDMDGTDVSKALPILEEIDIDYYYDSHELPYWIFEVVSLKTLSITNNSSLYSLPDTICNLSKLETLRLNFCKNLLELPETTARLNNLQFLDISDCTDLRKLPREIGKMQMLKKISIRSIRSCWRYEVVESVKKLKKLKNFKNLEVIQ